MTVATRQADQYCPLQCSDCRKTLIYAHTTSHKLPPCDICLGLSHVTCTRSWRLGGINPAIPHN